MANIVAVWLLRYRGSMASIDWVPAAPRRDPSLDAMRVAFARRRNELGLSFDAVAERSGLHRSSVIRLANGDRDGTIRAWAKLAWAVEMRFADLARVIDQDT